MTGMSGWRDSVIERSAEIDGTAIGDGAFGDGPAVWVGNREVAHFDDEHTLDIRLTKNVIRIRRAELESDQRVALRRTSSDWLEVQVVLESDVDYAVALIHDAVLANLPTAPSGLPPTGKDLERRRGFH